MVRMRIARVLVAAVAGGAVVGLGAFVAARVCQPAIAAPQSSKYECADPEAGDFFETLLECGPKHYSQYDEELIVRHFFRDKRGGVFVDVGAAHYELDSSTYYLEKELGWTGVAVDANDAYAADWRAHRAASQLFTYIVTDHGGTTEEFYRVKGKYFMSSASKDWAENVAKEPYETLHVPTITMNELLAKAGVTKIDFLTMDIESGEPAALAGFDIDRYAPALVCVEASPAVQPKLTAYFAAHHYERVTKYVRFDKVNWWFQPSAKL
jgi:FkbM family methyltransferase